MVAGGTAYWVTRRCSPRLNWDLDTWKVQIETSASCYRVMRARSDYVTVHLLFDQLTVPDEELQRGLQVLGQARYRHLVRWSEQLITRWLDELSQVHFTNGGFSLN